MASEMILGKSDELWRRRSSDSRKYLRMDMAGELLDSYFVETGLGWD